MGNTRLRRWCAGAGAWLRYRCNLMLGITAAVIGEAQAGPAASVQLGAVEDADPAGAGCVRVRPRRARRSGFVHSRRLAPAVSAAGDVSGGRCCRTGGAPGNRRAAAGADRVALERRLAGATPTKPPPKHIGPLAAKWAGGLCEPSDGAAGGAQSARQLARVGARWRPGGWRREPRGAAPRLRRSQRCGGWRAVNVATGACGKRAGCSAAVASRAAVCRARLPRSQRRGSRLRPRPSPSEPAARQQIEAAPVSLGASGAAAD